MLPIVGGFLLGYGIVKGNGSAVRWGIGLMVGSVVLAVVLAPSQQKAAAS